LRLPFSFSPPVLRDFIPPAATKLYLSPHHDDVAFSLGHFATTLPGGELINIFTRSNYLASTGIRLEDDADLTRHVMWIRTGEDQAFAERLELRRHALNYSEPPVLRRHPLAREGLEDDIETIKSLIPSLVNFAATTPAPHWLFVPLAVGRDVNHLAVRTLVVRNLAALLPHYAIAFYEDLPAARKLGDRRRAIRRLKAAVAPGRLERLLIPMGPNGVANKLELVNLYASQHRRAVRDLRQFTPRTGLFPVPHEAVWLLS
jgi:hypothetical protein